MSGCSEDVKEIVKAIAANGESVSLKELKAIKDEVEPGHKKEAKAPNKEANKVIENLESQLTSIKQGKAQAIETAKKAQDELQAALARIKQLEADNKALSNKVEELEATNRELVLQIEQSKTQSSTLDSQEVTQLDKACTEYVRLLKLNPRQMVNNTVQAVEYAGGEVVGSGRLQTFVLDGHTLTGQEVRIEASHYNN